jgi:hypothetical protein
MTMMRATLTAVATALTIAAASAEPKVTAATLENQLKRFPLAGQGSEFLDRGREFGVDPRLIAAIAGAETTYGRNLCGTFNAWNWFWNGTCAASPFDTFQSGIRTVSKFMTRSYLRKGYTTIPQIGGKYCAEGCSNWVPLVTKFYSEMGGDLTDLSYSELPPPPAPPDKSGTKPPTPTPPPPSTPSPTPAAPPVAPDAGESGWLIYGVAITIGLVLLGLGIGIGLALRRPSRAPR